MNTVEDSNTDRVIEDWMGIMKSDLKKTIDQASMHYNFDFSRDLPLSHTSSNIRWDFDDLPKKESLIKRSNPRAILLAVDNFVSK
ncbi:unnamed protein product [Blepharisma stoltei]|uniref:Uncharacterized protein n=1 Tax=Blepharisma stoltei TaxID=1481888 RepID=A0AAU9K4Q0_9CILI|nr:unnamed protein product [Blepharisma stoltei]